MVLLVTLPSSAQLHRAKVDKSPAEEFCWPAELGVGGVAEPKDSESEVFEEVFREVRSQQHLPQRSHRARLATCARSSDDKDDKALIDQL